MCSHAKQFPFWTSGRSRDLAQERNIEKTHDANQKPQNKLLPSSHLAQIDRIKPRLRHGTDNQEQAVRIPNTVPRRRQAIEDQ